MNECLHTLEQRVVRKDTSAEETWEVNYEEKPITQDLLKSFPGRGQESLVGLEDLKQPGRVS